MKNSDDIYLFNIIQFVIQKQKISGLSALIMSINFLLVSFADIVFEKRMALDVSLLTKKLILYCFVVSFGMIL